ncbi:hypothetical protein C8D77_12091 [Mesorhizobium loti]|uniref:Uncharacterized protein n=1 Tax=Rhizobium loti TaxID=381 RepID=A0A8E2W8B6_RHILI|nr:hypothetical protein [Mesorhizobium loti]PWJ86993.1 hypothetical protein C8D77_12091 [Mesorhizobium loti]
MPLAKVAERHIEAGVNAAINDGLWRDLDLAWCQDFLHHMPTVVVDQAYFTFLRLKRASVDICI